MMKHIKIFTLLLFSILLSINTYAQSDTLNRTDSKGKKQGYWKKYDKNILLYEGRFVNDVPTGIFKYYLENGKLKSITNFLNGTHKVKTVMYHDNESIAAEGEFIDQQKNGPWKYYAKDGKLIKEEFYAKNLKQGDWKTYSAQTGILLEEETYLDGALNGVQKRYFTTGEINTIIPYINGKMNGLAEVYYPNNVLSTRGMYHNNLRNGIWDYYDESGKLRKSIDFKNDRPLKTDLCLYNGSHQQKMNQDNIAYFQKVGDKINVISKDEKVMSFTDDWDSFKYWIDIIDFIPVSPSIYAAYNAVKGYNEIDENTVEVLIKPTPQLKVIAKEDYAKIVRAAFNLEIPEEE